MNPSVAIPSESRPVPVVPPLVLGSIAVGITVLPWFINAPWLVWGVPIMLCCVVAVAVGLFWRYARGTSNDASASGSKTASAQDAGLAPLVGSVLPAWRHQVDLVGQQTEAAGLQLVSSFSRVLELFDAAGIGSAVVGRTEQTSSSISLLTLCERELQPVVGSLASVVEGKDAMMENIRNLAAEVRSLHDLAEAVGAIAWQTNLLAVNAAIEAARAGETGRGFAIVAQEVRQLSQRSAQTGQKIASGVDRVVAMMEKTMAQAEAANQQDRQTVDVSGQLVEDVLKHVRRLGESADAMEAHGRTIRQEVEQLMLAMQFQDRVAQIMRCVNDDMEKLQQALAQWPQEDLISVQEWLSRLQSTYTMPEQHLR